MKTLPSIFAQAKPLLPRLPQSVMGINMEFIPASYLVWFTASIQPMGKSVLICLTAKEYESVIETVHPSNGATQGLFLEQVKNFADVDIDPSKCQWLDGLREVNCVDSIAVALKSEIAIRAINFNNIQHHSLNICWTHKVTGENRWTPIWATETMLTILFKHVIFIHDENEKFKWLKEQLFTEKNHKCFGSTTLSLFDSLKDELSDYEITDIQFTNADSMELYIYQILKGAHLPKCA